MSGAQLPEFQIANDVKHHKTTLRDPQHLTSHKKDQLKAHDPSRASRFFEAKREFSPLDVFLGGFSTEKTSYKNGGLREEEKPRFFC